MGNVTHSIIKSRANLFGIFRDIFDALPDDRLVDPHNALNIAVVGKPCSGKSALLAAGRQAISPGFDIDHIEDLDEGYWRGRFKGRDIELAYLNQFNAPLTDGFLGKRQLGGITIIQNYEPHQSGSRAIPIDLSIGVDSMREPSILRDFKIEDAPADTRQVFERMACANPEDMVRLVRLEAMSRDLLEHRPFQDFLKGLAPDVSIITRTASSAAAGLNRRLGWNVGAGVMAQAAPVYRG